MVGIYFSGTGNSRYAVGFFCNEYDEATKAFLHYSQVSGHNL